MNILSNIPMWLLALLATLLTWFLTAIGAGLVFFFKEINKKILNLLLGFASGVMIAASFWSLLSPAIELSEKLEFVPWLFPAIGFTAGGLLIVFTSIFLDRAIKSKNSLNPTKFNKIKRCGLLISAITLHNIPEGMAVGVAFGGILAGIPGSTIVAAISLAIGIGLQNLPEGASVSLPLRREGLGRFKSFLIGQASGLVEPLFGMLGFFLATLVQQILPFLLSFSAGAMVAVVTKELIPESSSENSSLATIGCVIGFVVMMTLDVALG